MIESALTTIGALLLVIGLLFGLFWTMRRLGAIPGQMSRKQSERELTILEVLPIDPKNRLILVEWGAKTYLLAAGANGVQAIDKQPQTSDLQPITDKRKSFDEMVRQSEEGSEPRDV